MHLQVSSLYGRVYRRLISNNILSARFLPIREGVSPLGSFTNISLGFPPYTGGCIAHLDRTRSECQVSSLYGRVYRIRQHSKVPMRSFLPIREGVSRDFRNLYSNNSFPPYTGGCIKEVCRRNFKEVVSSLYGRVYRQRKRKQIVPKSFLPIREGVSFLT